TGDGDDGLSRGLATVVTGHRRHRDTQLTSSSVVSDLNLERRLVRRTSRQRRLRATHQMLRRSQRAALGRTLSTFLELLTGHTDDLSALRHLEIHRAAHEVFGTDVLDLRRDLDDVARLALDLCVGGDVERDAFLGDGDDGLSRGLATVVTGHRRHRDTPLTSSSVVSDLTF